MRGRLIELMQEWGNENTDSFPFESVADYLLTKGVIVPLCKFGDTVYVIPSETNYRLNNISGREENNRVYEQKVCEVRIFANNRYLLSTCDGLQSVHSDLYNDTWFLSKEKAKQALKERGENKNETK